MNTEPITVETTAIAMRPSMAVGQAMSVQEILAQVKLIQEVMRAVMVEKEHFGTIPGCGDKKVLLQPGAQKLTMTFRLAPEYEIQEVNLERGHKEYRVICTLKSIQSGNFVGQGVGCCSSMESKYRWRGGTRKCPKCGKEAIIMGKRFRPTDPEPGWLCWTKKEGCGATWAKGAAEIEGQSIEKQENDSPADTFNTVLKMAKKRAFVDATITATAASDIFTQDIGDDGEPEERHESPKSVPQPTRPPFNPTLPIKPTKTTNGGAESGTLTERIAGLKAKLDNRATWATGYLRSFTADGSDANSALMPNEELDALNEGQVNWIALNWKTFETRLDEYIKDNDTMPDDSNEPPGVWQGATQGQPPPSPESIGGPSVTGVIANVSVKTGTSKRGAWINFGIQIGDSWFNTFSKTLGDHAIKLKEQQVQLFYEETAKGNTALAIGHDGIITKAGGT